MSNGSLFPASSSSWEDLKVEFVWQNLGLTKRRPGNHGYSLVLPYVCHLSQLGNHSRHPSSNCLACLRLSTLAKTEMDPERRHLKKNCPVGHRHFGVPKLYRFPGCKSSHDWGQWRFEAISVQNTRVSAAFQGCCDRALAPNPPVGSSLRHSGDASWSDRWWRRKMTKSR